MRRILVTGVSGLVGNEVARYLSLQDENVVYYSFYKNKILGIERPIQLDLENVDLRILNINFDCIIHCAAVIPSADNSDEWIGKINRKIDDNIIRYCKERKCRLVYMSSTNLYGLNNRDWIDEKKPLDVQSSYAKQKKVSEEKILEQIKESYILRISSPYGIRMKQKNVLNIFFNNSRNGKDLIYYGEGSRTQNFTNIFDIARACDKCINSSETGIYNIASDAAISMKNLASLFSRYAKEICNISVEVKKGKNDDPQEFVRNNIDISLAKSRLGWCPKINIEEGVKQLFLNTVNLSDERKKNFE